MLTAMNYFNPAPDNNSTHYTYIVRVDGDDFFEQEFDAVDETIARDTYKLNAVQAFKNDAEVTAEVQLLKRFHFEGTDEWEEDVIESNC